MTESLERALHEPETRVVVVGGGVAGLVVARDSARPGFAVTVVEASESIGGSVASTEIAGIRVDVGAESFATRGGHVAQLIHELGLDEHVVSPNPAGAWLQLKDKAVPIPAGGLLGIPGSPLAQDVIAAIGWRGALRAYLDRLAPVLKIGHERNLGTLVRRRMGRAVLDQLVTPVTSGVYSADPDDLDVAVAAPGLNRSLTALGSLSGAVSDLRSASKPGSAVGGLSGGMSVIVDALAADLGRLGAEIVTGRAVVALETADEKAAVETAAEEAALGAPASDGSGEDEERPAAWRVVLDDGTALAADVVVVATPAPYALALLTTASEETRALADLEWPTGTDVELATLVLDAPELDVAPRGTGVLVAEGAPVEAKAMTHATAKWHWLQEAAGTGRHVVRVSYGRPGAANPAQGLTDDELLHLAVRDAGTMFDMPLKASQVIAYARTRWINAVPHALRGQKERLEIVEECVSRVPGLEVTGSWIAGTGLASVIPNAKEAASRVRGLRWRLLTEKD